MAFIRTKKIKGKKYAYIVENKWKKKKVKQRVKKYLGRVYSFERSDDGRFEEFVSQDLAGYMKSRDAKTIILDLIRWELHNHGFKDSNGLLVNSECSVDMKKLRIRNQKGSSVALEFNEGLLNEYKLKRFLKFNFGSELSEEEAAYKLAKEFVENGLDVPHEVFIGVFQKIFN